jgi:acyl-CoA reductase-like NAD-dependent aldehyde dehydrogenase
MSPHADDVIATLQDTVADGRLTNPVYRREQLAKLLSALIDSRESIKDALVKDTFVTQSEAFAEIYQTLAALRSHIDATSPTTQLAAEYSIAEGKDATSLRQGLGIVALDPQSHTPLFSIFSPLGAAVAAGNPVVLVVSKS